MSVETNLKEAYEDFLKLSFVERVKLALKLIFKVKARFDR